MSMILMHCTSSHCLLSIYKVSFQSFLYFQRHEEIPKCKDIIPYTNLILLSVYKLQEALI